MLMSAREHLVAFDVFPGSPPPTRPLQQPRYRTSKAAAAGEGSEGATVQLRVTLTQDGATGEQLLHALPIGLRLAYVDGPLRLAQVTEG